MDPARKEDVLSSSRLRYYVNLLRRKWFWLLAGVAIGTAAGYFIFLLRAPVHTARAAFVMANEIAESNEERFGSRKYLLSAVRKLNHIEVEYFSDQGLRGKYNMYDQTPFVIYLYDFPDHYLDVLHSIRFEPDARFTIFFNSDWAPAEAKGFPGRRLRVGAMSLVLETTPYWRPKLAGQTFYFRVNSEEKTIRDIRRRVRIIRTTSRPNRIDVTFEDQNRNRAKDFMEALCEVIWEDWRRRQIDRKTGELRKIEAEMHEVLDAHRLDFAKVFAKINPGTIGRAGDSLIRLADSLYLRDDHLGLRLGLLRDFRGMQYSGIDFPEKFRLLSATGRDSALAAMIGRRTALGDRLDEEGTLREFHDLGRRIAGLTGVLIAEDSLALLRLRKQLTAIQHALSIRTDVRNELLLSHEDVDPKVQFRFERYLELLQTHRFMEKELLESVPDFDQLSAPYLMLQRTKIEKFLSVLIYGLVGGLVSLFLVLVTGNAGSRFRTSAQLRAISGLPLLSELGPGPPGPGDIRPIRMSVGLRHEPDDRIIAVLSDVARPAQDTFARALASGFHASGYSVLLLVPEDQPPSPDVPFEIRAYPLEGMTPGDWLLSDRPARLHEDVAQDFDRVVFTLPALEEFPESILAALHADTLLYFVYAGRSRKAPLAELEKLVRLEQFASLKPYLVFVR